MNLITWPQAKIDFLQAQGFSPTTLSRFWKHVRFTPTCWLWEGALHSGGYGQLSNGALRNPIRVHVLSWIIHFGLIPDGLCVLHDCPFVDNRRCVNPWHLWLGTKAMNNRDKVNKGQQPRGEMSGPAKLTESEVLRIREVSQMGYSQTYIAEKFGVAQNSVSRLLSRHHWKHI